LKLRIDVLQYNLHAAVALVLAVIWLARSPVVPRRLSDELKFVVRLLALVRTGTLTNFSTSWSLYLSIMPKHFNIHATPTNEC
jgi:hypothetical protein